jgi:hypothetical protein
MSGIAFSLMILRVSWARANAIRSHLAEPPNPPPPVHCLRYPTEDATSTAEDVDGLTPG